MRIINLKQRNKEQETRTRRNNEKGGAEGNGRKIHVAKNKRLGYEE